MTYELSKDEHDALILRAIGASNLAALNTDAEKELAIAESLHFITRMLDERSIPSRMLNAVKLIGVVEDVTLEESSQRYIITFVAAKGNDGKAEQVRTDRLNGPTGDIVRGFIGQGLVGKRCLICKELVQADDKPQMKVRITPYVKVIE